MSSSLRRGVAAAFLAFSIAALTACGAGNDAETNEVEPDNAAAQLDDIKVQNVIVILPEGGEGPGAVTGRLFNGGSEDQTLESVTLPDSGATVELVPAEGESRVVVPAGGSLALGGEGAAAALIGDPASTDVALGNAQHVVFTLSETGGISLFARVVSDESALADYRDWVPDPTEPAMPEETAPPTDEPTDEPTDDATDEPTDEATAADEADEEPTAGETADTGVIAED